MTAIAILRNEHATILEVLDLLERHARAVRAGAAVDREFARWIVQFLQEFADDTHQAKEEGVLFGLLLRRGLTGDDAAIAGMLSEHQTTRRQAEVLRQAAEKGESGGVAEAGMSLADTFRRHVLRENESLFGRAEALLTPADDAEALEAFGRVVHQRDGALVRQRHLAAIERWRGQFREPSP
jgi:hemerythrin-like domain-containing protein